MPIPHALTSKKSVVYSYTADLDKAAQTLAGFLGCSCVRVRLNKGGFKVVLDPIPTGGEVAWLVGHGLSTDSQLGSLARGTFIEVDTLLGILDGDGYTAVVDTGCQPDQRRVVARGNYAAMDYYATDDGRDVFQIVSFTSADDWWDNNNIQQK